MRRKWLKISAIIAAVVIVLIATLIVLANILITPERVRSAVLPVAEDFLHRPVSLEKIEVGLFSGISCSDLVIGERQGEKNFIEADMLVLRYRFWPLLFGRVMIDEATLKRPAIRMVRNSDGSFNFDDLLKPDSDGAGKGRTVASDGEGGPPVDLLVTRLTVDNGEVGFTDHAVRPGGAVVTRLADLNLSASEVSLGKEFPLTVDFLLNDAPVSWEGSVDPARRGVSGQLQVSGLSGAPLAPYLGDALPGELRSFQLDADLHLDGDGKAMTSRGDILLDKIGMTLQALPDVHIEDASLKLDHDLTVEPEEETVVIRSFRIAYNRVELETQDARVDYGANPELDMGVHLKKLSLSDLVSALPKSLVGEMDDLAPSGKLEATMDLSGNVSSLETLIADGSVILEQAGVNLGHLKPRLSGTVRLENDELTGRKIQMETAGNLFVIDLTAKKLFDEIKYIETEIQSEKIDFNAFLPPDKDQANSSDSNRAAAESAEKGGKQIGPIELPLEMEGKIRIVEGRYKTLDLKDVRFDWNLKDNLVRFENIGAVVASGTLGGKASVDLGRKGLGYDADIQIKEVAADELVTAMVPRAAETVFGELDLSSNLTGSGTQASEIKRNLVGEGRFAIRQGRLTGAGLMKGLAEFLDLKDLRVFRFDRGEGTFNIHDGELFLDASFDGSKARLKPSGRIGLDQSVDMSVKTFLSPKNTQKLAGKGTLGEVIADDQGWGLVPLKITGKLADPSVSLDRKALSEQVKKGAERKLREKVQEKIFGENGESGENGDEEPARKILEDTLRGVFGN
ncbi:MAG TPA: AsmA family protein [Desulfuromonadales bacterium]|nr:AsmA family protein [Desulfuromonadales bacterium]